MVTSLSAISADDPRDTPMPAPPSPVGEPPIEEPTETPPTREEPDVVDPSPSEAPMIA